MKESRPFLLWEICFPDVESHPLQTHWEQSPALWGDPSVEEEELVIKQTRPPRLSQYIFRQSGSQQLLVMEYWVYGTEGVLKPGLKKWGKYCFVLFCFVSTVASWTGPGWQTTNQGVCSFPPFHFGKRYQLSRVTVESKQTWDWGVSLSLTTSVPWAALGFSFLSRDV